MAIRQVITTEDEALLRRKSKPVEVFDDKLKILVSDMADTMAVEDGVGLAAPQIGILKRVIVCIIDGDIRAFVNPVISDIHGAVAGQEGCLSIPGRCGTVLRPKHLTLKAQDIDGFPIEYHAEDYAARVICHEVDHLNGILFTDRISD